MGLTDGIAHGVTALLLLPASYCSGTAPSRGALVFTATRTASVRFDLPHPVTISLIRGRLSVAGSYGGLYLEPVAAPKGDGFGIVDVPSISRYGVPDRILFGAVSPTATSVRLAKGGWVAHVLGDGAVTVEVHTDDLDGVRRHHATGPSRATGAVRDVRAAVSANVVTAPVDVPAASFVLAAAALVREPLPDPADAWYLDTCLRTDPVPVCVPGSGRRRGWHDTTSRGQAEEGVVVEFRPGELPAGRRNAVATFATSGEVVDARTVVFTFTP